MAAGTRLAIAVERDRTARTALAAGLRRGGVARVQRRASVEEVRLLLAGGQALRLLAIGLDAGALELIRDCRQRFPQAVILAIDHVSGPDTAAEAFRAGADDVLRMPYPESELVARLARRMGEAIPAADALATFAETSLTPVEARILRLLMERRGQIVSRNQLAQAIDKADWTYGDRRFDVHITRIRRKMASGLAGRVTVRTVRSEGYRLELQDG